MSMESCIVHNNRLYCVERVNITDNYHQFVGQLNGKYVNTSNSIICLHWTKMYQTLKFERFSYWKEVIKIRERRQKHSSMKKL